MKTVHQIIITFEVTEKDYNGFWDSDDEILSQVTDGIDFHSIIQQKIDEEMVIQPRILPDDFEGFRIKVDA